MKIIATNIGERKEVAWKGKKIVTGMYKYPVDRPVFIDTENVKDDAICDTKNHGGIVQAVYAYSYSHYEYWKNLYPDLDWHYGMFGENLTVDEMDETAVFVGDTFKVGEVILEATVQRSPCMKLGVRFNDMNVVKQFWNTTFCGVYFKVLQTGFVKVGDEFVKIKSCPENNSIADLLLKRKAENGV